MGRTAWRTEAVTKSVGIVNSLMPTGEQLSIFRYSMKTAADPCGVTDSPPPTQRVHDQQTYPRHG
jgi:hypothetical protein